MPTTKTDLRDYAASSSEALLKLTRIAFTSVEKLTALNLNTSRTVLEEGLARSGNLLQAKDPKAAQAAQSALPGTLAGSTQVYIHELQEITSETQKAVAELVTSYMTLAQDAGTGNGDWLKGFGMFKAFAEQMNTLTDVSSKMVGDATAQLARAKGNA